MVISSTQTESLDNNIEVNVKYLIRHYSLLLILKHRVAVDEFPSFNIWWRNV